MSIANPGFGFQVSADGSGYTWAGNSRENRLTPWSNDPVSDRPGEAIYLRDTTAACVGTDGPADAARCRHLRRPARAGLQPVRAHARTASSSTCCSSCRRRPIKVSRLRIRNVSGARVSLTRDGLCEWVLGTPRGTTAPFVSTEIDPVTGGLLARNCGAGPTPAWRSPTSAAGRRRGPATGRSSSGATARSSGRRHWRQARRSRPHRRRPRSLRRPADDRRAGRERPSNRLFLGEARHGLDAQALIERWRGADLDAALQSVREDWNDVLGAVTGADAGPGVRHHGERLAAVPDPRLPRAGAQRVLPGERRLRVPRPAAGHHGADRGAGPRWRASSCCARPAASSSRATCSIGGCRRPGAGFAPASPTTASGWAMRRRITSRRPATRACSTRSCRSWTGRRWSAGKHDAYFQPRRRRRAATLYEHCARALDRSLARGAARPAADRRRRLERRHEPRRRGRARREHLARLVPARWRCRASRRWPRRAASGARRDAGARTPAALRACGRADGWDGDWYRRALFRRRHAARSAASERMPHRLHRAVVERDLRRRGAARAGRAMASLDRHLVRREDGLVLLFTPPFDRLRARSRLHPGLSARDPRERRAVHPRRRLGGDRLRAARRRRQGRRAVRACSIRSTTRRTRDAAMRYKVEPYVVAADVYRRRRTSGAAAGPGTPARPPGCIARASSGFSAAACMARRCCSIRASRGAGRNSRSVCATAERATRSRSRIRAAQPGNRQPAARWRELPPRPGTGPAGG